MGNGEGSKAGYCLKAPEADEERDARVLCDVLHRIRGTQANSLSDYERPESHAPRHGFLITPGYWLEQCGVVFSRKVPRDELRQLHPMSPFVQLCCERQEEFMGQQQLISVSAVHAAVHGVSVTIFQSPRNAVWGRIFDSIFRERLCHLVKMYDSKNRIGLGIGN